MPIVLAYIILCIIIIYELRNNFLDMDICLYASKLIYPSEEQFCVLTVDVNLYRSN